MTKKVLILGAGMISKPMVRYLFDNTDYHVTMASRTVGKAEKIINGHPNGTAISLNVKDEAALEKLIIDCDLAASLLPYPYHTKVAELCIKHKKQMVTTSYVSDAMKALDSKSKDAGILILNECGLDPGIDHMSAMRVIHDVEEKGGKVVSFKSSTGALPAHEANNNPFGYKFSWAPRGVLTSFHGRHVVFYWLRRILQNGCRMVKLFHILVSNFLKIIISRMFQVLVVLRIILTVILFHIRIFTVLKMHRLFIVGPLE